MSLFVRRALVLALVLAAIVLVACEEATPTPRPPTRPKPTETPAPTFTSTVTPVPSTPTAVVVGANTIVPPTAIPPSTGPKIIVNSPYLPYFGPFPPKAIPSRASNINPLTGLVADPAKLARRPIIARVGNDKPVRDSFWQSGTNAADLVFEELIDVLGTQYATTRFSAVFLANDPPIIGPIRSERIINLQFAPMLDGVVVSAGGSDETRWLFANSPVINLDEAFNQSAFCYIERGGTYNYMGRLYTTGPRLRDYLQAPSAKWITFYNGADLQRTVQQKKAEAPVQLYGFNFSETKPAGQTVNTIGLSQAPWPSGAATQWQYNTTAGKYMRSSAGAPQMDNSYNVTAKWGNGADCIISGTETKTQVSASNVVVLSGTHEKTTIVEDSNNAVSVYINLVGQGDAQFFRDGVMVKGKWQRASEQEFFNFVDNAGNSYNLKPGNTWFEIVPIGYTVDVK